MFKHGVDPITHRPTHLRAPNGRFWPRGFRNGNPGNIDFAPENKWQGQVGRELRESGGPAFRPRFAVFQSAMWGIRAGFRLLITYQDRYGLNTIAGIVPKWAPPGENDTAAYIERMEKLTGFKADQELDMHTFEDAVPLLKAKVLHELGDPRAYGLPAWYPDEVWEQAAIRAGLVRRAPKPIRQDRDVVAGSTAVALTGLSAADGMGLVKQFVEPGSVTAQAIGLLAALAVAYLLFRAMRRRQRDAA
jgi:hypothetical protein